MDHRVEVKVVWIDWAKFRKKEVIKVLYHGDVEGMQKNGIVHLHIWVSYGIFWWSTWNWKTHRQDWNGVRVTEMLLNLNFSGERNKPGWIT